MLDRVYDFIRQPDAARIVWLLGFFVCAFPAVAQAPAPTQEFWDYLADYSDETGEVVDPADLDQLVHSERSNDVDDSESEISSNSPQPETIKTRRAKMKLKKAETLQSSSVVKGEGL